MIHRPLKHAAIGLAALVATLTSSAHAQSGSQPNFTEIESDKAVATVFACFSRNASFPSFAHLADSHHGGSAIYRLRFERTMLEEVLVQPSANGGSHIRIQLSPDYAGRDVRAFKALRGDVLVDCARSHPTAYAQALQEVQP